jgi:hypothetical protein
MKVDAAKLKEHLQYVMIGSVSQKEMTSLVHCSRSIIQAHFGTHRHSIVQLSLQHGLTQVDLAYDCIAEAFARTSDGSYTQIKNFVESLRSPIDQLPAAEVFMAFRRYLACVADAQLARLYAQADPVGARIHRNIREQLKSSDTLKVERDFPGLVLRPAHEDSLDHLDPLPLSKIEDALLGTSNESIPRFLQCLSKLLLGQIEYRRSVPLFDIVGVLKRSLGGEYEYSIAEHGSPELDGLADGEIETIRTQVEVTLKEKILLTYFARGKIDRRQAEAMASAFHDLLWDWCFGDEHKGLYDYLRLYFPITEDEYENTMRTKMEYLLKLARVEFEARLVKEL